MLARGQRAGTHQCQGCGRPCERCQEQRLVELPPAPGKRRVCKGSAMARAATDSERQLLSLA